MYNDIAEIFWPAEYYIVKMVWGRGVKTYEQWL